ncbi:MAG: AmmeMemoRadiSam system protein B [Kiritimatiellaeota bacterium]|nr:AmmeMemoRadiSam system protein B [Kiritimatiellota bacterium]
MTKKIMFSPLSGQWFPATESGLRADIAERCRDIYVVRKGDVCAAVVPHAGYRFSGRVAAGVYLRIDPKKIKRIIVMGPSHYVAMDNQISVPDATHFRTPLGDLAVDTAFVAELRKLPFVTHEPMAHQREHSDQIQLPLIQACLATNIPVVCAVIGQFDAQHLLPAAETFRQLLDTGTLVVASSDFTHYGANYGYVPFTQDVEKNIETLDMGVFELFAKKDLPGFLRYLADTGATVCGCDPLAFLIAMMPENASVEKTAYDTSGKQLNDTLNSVSYIGALVRGSWGDPAKKTASAATFEGKLPEADCERLLTLARTTIAEAFVSDARKASVRIPDTVTDGMNAVRGGFVTLNMHGDLRGCIGEILPRREIWKVVREQALNAAFNDPRFPPLTEREFADIDLEISILTPPKPVDCWRDIVIGKHGMVLSKAGRSAVFLPQVAPEQGWTLEETLAHLSQKAGLPHDAWKEGATFLVFEAQVVHAKKQGAC